MAASSWSYFVPYDDDISAAFVKLQADVFARGSFYTTSKLAFRTIDELRAEQGAKGTHSILDMKRIDEEAAPSPNDLAAMQEEFLTAMMGGPTNDGTVYPMSDDELQACFATTAPTRETVDSGELAVWESCETGTGRYAIVFDESAHPVSIYFAGVSGE